MFSCSPYHEPTTPNLKIHGQISLRRVKRSNLEGQAVSSVKRSNLEGQAVSSLYIKSVLLKHASE
jgi:hypothetical protein